VTKSFRSQLERTLFASDTLSNEITAFAIGTNATLPFVTLPDFEFLASSARATANSVFISYSPYITADLKDEWEAYSAENLGHDVLAYEQEVESKAAQDQSFGLETPEYRGTALEYLEMLKDYAKYIDVSKIWTATIDPTTMVSGWVISQGSTTNCDGMVASLNFASPGSSTFSSLAYESTDAIQVYESRPSNLGLPRRDTQC